MHGSSLLHKLCFAVTVLALAFLRSSPLVVAVPVAAAASLVARGGGASRNVDPNRSPVGLKTEAKVHSSLHNNNKNKNRNNTAWLVGLKNGMASAMAAFCVKTCLQPVDVVKTIQQYHQATSGQAPLTVLAACQEIMSRPGGVWNFYAGLGVTVFGSMPGVALYFGVYSYCKKTLTQTKWGKRYPLASIALSAAIGNSVASFSRVPYEVLKQKLQTGAYVSTWAAFRDIATSEKWLSLIFPKGGIAIQMIRDVPYAICTLLLYETLQTAFHKSRSNKGWDFCLGGISGGIGSWVTNPFDVVKTRLQINSDLYDGSVWQCTQDVWSEGGAAAFLRGSIPRLVHKVPANAFFFLFYEFFRRALGVETEETKTKES